MNTNHSRPLTDIQVSTVAAVFFLTAKLGYAPSATEIADLVGAHRATTQHRLDGLRLRGALVSTPNVVRSIRVGELTAEERARVEARAALWARPTPPATATAGEAA